MNQSNTKPGSYAWLKARGLLVISDHVREYRAVRLPCGPYRVPLPTDYLEVRK